MGLDDIDDSDDELVLASETAKEGEHTRCINEESSETTNEPIQATETKREKSIQECIVSETEEADSKYSSSLLSKLTVQNSATVTSSDNSETTEAIPDTFQAPAKIENDTSNDAQDELMKLMQKKRKEKKAEEARKTKLEEEKRNKELMKEGGLFQKGFLKNSKKAKPAGAKPKRKDVIDLSHKISGNNAKNAPDLTIPEVQEAMKTNLQNDKSWLTPELGRAFASRPDLIQGMQSPKIQEAMKLMQSDPKGAQEKYKDDEEVSKYFLEFAKLMGTHFDVLGEKEKKNPGSKSNNEASLDSISKASTTTAPVDSKTAFDMAAQQNNLSAEEKAKFQDPKVIEAMSDPKVQQCIYMLKSGREMDMRAIGRQDFQLFQKLQYLISKGILGTAA